MSSQTITVERRRRRGLVIALVALYAWVAGHFATFTWPAAAATFVPGAIGLAASTRSTRARAQCRSGLRLAGWITWTVLIGAIVALEAYGFFAGSSTAGHPTISNILNHGLHSTLTRAAAFFAWIAFGDWLLGR